MKQLLLDIAPPSPPTLANFVPGRNAELLQTLDEMLAGRGRERFIYLWGGAGCGRSHLLRAAVTACHQQGLNATYIACGAQTGFGAHGDCVAVDDVERLDAAAQIELFNRYNRMREEGEALLLVSGPTAPARLALRADLVTRLGWGLVYQVHELTDEEKAQAMKNHAVSRGFDLPQEVCSYLLRHGRRDLPSLIATLDALDRYSLANRRQVTVPLLRALLQAAS